MGTGIPERSEGCLYPIFPCQAGHGTPCPYNGLPAATCVRGLRPYAGRSSNLLKNKQLPEYSMSERSL